MEYSIQQLARLAGVSTRTLRWYDEISLLHPSRTADSGYRYYGPAEVDRLQDILFYRALGVELARIRDCLNAPSFDRVTALRGHLSALETERARLDGLIRSVKQTIDAQERSVLMEDKQKFEAFKRRAVEENERRYGGEVREKYGEQALTDANARIMGLTQEQYSEWVSLNEEILARLAAAVANGTEADSEEGLAIAQLHRRWLALTGNPYSPAMHRGLAEMYVADERFTAYYDKTASGCAKFLRDAIVRWADEV